MSENGNPPAIRAGHKLMHDGQSGCVRSFGSSRFFIFTSSSPSPAPGNQTEKSVNFFRFRDKIVFPLETAEKMVYNTLVYALINAGYI